MKSAHLLMILLAGQVPAQMDIAETLRRELASLDIPLLAPHALSGKCRDCDSIARSIAPARSERAGRGYAPCHIP